MNIAREERLCTCGEGIQTIFHCFNECSLTKHLFHEQQYNSIQDVFLDKNIYFLLHQVCKILKIPV